MLNEALKDLANRERDIANPRRAAVKSTMNDLASRVRAAFDMKPKKAQNSAATRGGVEQARRARRTGDDKIKPLVPLHQNDEAKIRHLAKRLDAERATTLGAHIGKLIQDVM